MNKEVIDCKFCVFFGGFIYIIILSEIVATDNPDVAFNDVDAAFMVGAMPRREGMERKDLLKANVKIFKAQGQAIDRLSKKTVKVIGGAGTC